MTPVTREWLRKAEADLRVARREVARRPAYHDVVCFHCQQAVEKYLKGMLQEWGVVFPKTHDLAKITDLVLPSDPTIKPLRRLVRPLSRYAVEYRYPGFKANSRKSKSALA